MKNEIEKLNNQAFEGIMGSVETMEEPRESFGEKAVVKVVTIATAGVVSAPFVFQLAVVGIGSLLRNISQSQNNRQNRSHLG